MPALAARVARVWAALVSPPARSARSSSATADGLPRLPRWVADRSMRFTWSAARVARVWAALLSPAARSASSSQATACGSSRLAWSATRVERVSAASLSPAARSACSSSATADGAPDGQERFARNGIHLPPYH